MITREGQVRGDGVSYGWATVFGRVFLSLFPLYFSCFAGVYRASIVCELVVKRDVTARDVLVDKLGYIVMYWYRFLVRYFHDKMHDLLK